MVLGRPALYLSRNWDDTSPERAEALWQRHNWSIAALTLRCLTINGLIALRSNGCGA